MITICVSVEDDDKICDSHMHYMCPCSVTHFIDVCVCVYLQNWILEVVMSGEPSV